MTSLPQASRLAPSQSRTRMTRLYVSEATTISGRYACPSIDGLLKLISANSPAAFVIHQDPTHARTVRVREIIHIGDNRFLASRISTPHPQIPSNGPAATSDRLIPF